MKIHITHTKKRPQPKSGDTKIVDGVAMIRQPVFSELHRAWIVRNGKHVYEWVVAGSEKDRRIKI